MFLWARTVKDWSQVRLAQDGSSTCTPKPTYTIFFIDQAIVLDKPYSRKSFKSYSFTHYFFCPSRLEALQTLSTHMLSPIPSDQIRDFLLPALADPDASFPFLDLLQALVRPSQTVDSFSGQELILRELTVTGSLWLLHAVLVLGEHCISQYIQSYKYM